MSQEAMKQALDAPSEPGVPARWVLVPVEPTPEMCQAAVIFANGKAVYKNVSSEVLKIEESIYGETYAAMLAAAPKAPQPAAAPLTDELLRIAVAMLAGWCVAVDENGTGWDDWDEHYKDARYRPGPLREMLDQAITQELEDRYPGIGDAA
jgi:hypothetical protein